MKKNIFKILLIALLSLILLASCSSDPKDNDSKKESTDDTEHTETSSAKKVADIPNPCEVVDFADIQAVMNQTMTSDNGEKGKYFDDGETLHCSWEGKDEPFSTIEIRLGKNGVGSNSFVAAQAVNPENQFDLEGLGDKAIVHKNTAVIYFSHNDIFYAVQAVQNEKDFSADTSIPEKLKIEGSSISGTIASNLSAEYLIAKKIIENN